MKSGVEGAAVRELEGGALQSAAVCGKEPASTHHILPSPRRHHLQALLSRLIPSRQCVPLGPGVLAATPNLATAVPEHVPPYALQVLPYTQTWPRNSSCMVAKHDATTHTVLSSALTTHF
ncbi:hypothetical protein E2C01_016486 [Portunus trituberculatus]|uniref:Uncharacterized protein n=1 Tax=Portunus trituberculatus TaxID=210409 RepID=A0A5B7DQN0_PORTR|nr:hypothetical protein [Portunus trituberculatus]